MNYKEQIVETGSIDLQDATFRITSETRVDNLARSIEAVGLINPPFLIRKASHFIVVAGFRRIFACQARGRSTRQSGISARILDADTDSLACAKLAIADNASERNLDLVEESRAYAMLAGFFPNDPDRARAAASLGLSDNPSRIKKIEAVCSLPPSIQDGILANTISLNVALELAEFPREATTRFSDLFNKLKLSINKQRELILYIKEISIIENKPVAEVIGDERIQSILNDTDIDGNLKTRRIRTHLKQRRFPEITRAENDFQESLKLLRPGKGIKLIPPAHFEGTEYELSICFSSLEELKVRQETLDKLIRNPTMADILERRRPG